MKEIFSQTAWTMSVPQLYGGFHIVVAVAGIILALALARFVAAGRNGKSFQARDLFDRRLYFIVGFVLFVLEMYKQFFCFYIVDGGRYGIFRLPFQLCSLPIYLCIIASILKDKPRLSRVLVTFLMDFSLMGGLMVFVDPSGIFSNYVLLTFHGIIWHLLIIFIGAYGGFCIKETPLTWKDYKKVLPLFGAGVVIAAILNVVLWPLGYINLFYITPYEPSVQIVFSWIANKAGIMVGNIVYVGAMIAGGALFHKLWLLYQIKHFKDKDPAC